MIKEKHAPGPEESTELNDAKTRAGRCPVTKTTQHYHSTGQNTYPESITNSVPKYQLIFVYSITLAVRFENLLYLL